MRELENALTRAVLLAADDTLGPEHLELGTGERLHDGEHPGDHSDAGTELDAVMHAAESAHVQHILVETGGHKSRTAEILGISRGRLDRIIEKHELLVDPAG